MSPKELQYIQDILGHAKFMHEKAHHMAEKVECQELKKTLESVACKHKEIYNNIQCLLCK